MIRLKLADFSKIIEIRASWFFNHGKDAKYVFLSINDSQRNYLAGVSLTTDEARQLARNLTEQADYIDKVVEAANAPR